MNTSRILPELARRFGLVGMIESRRVVLPLKGVECAFSVCGGTVEVCMTQIFRQENAKALDCQYLFPLPADASVYSCEADINGRIIRAQVRERQEARRLAQEHKQAGHRTALVESERENLFTLSLTNLQPEDFIIVSLRYIQPLRHLGEMLSVEIPFCPGVRYIPGKPLLRSNQGKGVVDDTDQVPDASRITPVRIDAEHPDAAFVEVRGELKGGFVDRGTIKSPSHCVVASADNETCAIALLDKGEVPDRDFVLRWQERRPSKLACRAWTREAEGETFALLEIRAPEHLSGNPTPLDFYFLVDRSGSMQGQKWEKAVAALQQCVALFGAEDRVMVTLFESTFQDFAECPLPPQELLRDTHFTKLAKLGTAGGTEMGPALEHVIEMAGTHSRGRARNLILITDAQVGNEKAILDIMDRDKDFPLHCFGIDVALNDALLLALTRQQGGTFHSLNPNDDIEKAVTTLARTLRLPVLRRLEPGAGWEPSGGRLPNLYAGQVLYASVKSQNSGRLELEATVPSGERLKLDLMTERASGAAPFLHWCKARIQGLLAKHENAEAVAMSVKSNLICPLTAFIAWDDSEKVAVADHELVQPNQELAETLAEATGPALCKKMSAPPAPAAGAGSFFDKLCELTDDAPAPPAAFAKRTRSGFAGFVGRAAAKFMPNAATISEHLARGRFERELRAVCEVLCGADWKKLWHAVLDKVFGKPGAERQKLLAALDKLIAELQRRVREVQRLKGDDSSGDGRSGKTTITPAMERIAKIKAEAREMIAAFVK